MTTEAAYARAVAAAAAAPTAGERAELLLLACALPGAAPDPATRVDAARAALAAGRPRAAATVLTTRGAAGRRRGRAARRGAAAAGRPGRGRRPPRRRCPTASTRPCVAARDRVLLLVRLADDPAGAAAGRRPPARPAGASRAARRASPRCGPRPRPPGWEYGLASAAAAAGAAGDALSARWSAWLLVETLAADGRLDEAAATATTAAAACADDLAYSWQTRFLAAGLWCAALRGGAGADDVVRRAGDLTDRTAPALARAYAVAAAGLVEADGGLLAPARARLTAAPAAPGAAALLDWVAREAAWLDGQPDRAAAPAAASGTPLVDGLRHITARWAAFDAGSAAAFDAGSPLPAVAATLTAWSGAGPFDRAAAAWHDLAVREEVRCLLAAGLHESDPARAVPPLLEAERIAEEAGLVVLLGRARRALRRHAVRRDNRGPRSGDDVDRAGTRRAAAGGAGRADPADRGTAGHLGGDGGDAHPGGDAQAGRADPHRRRGDGAGVARMTASELPRYVLPSATDATTVLRRLARAGWTTREGFALAEPAWDMTPARLVLFGRVPDLETVRLAVLAAARGTGVVAIADVNGDVGRALLADLGRLGQVRRDADAEPDGGADDAVGRLVPEQKALLDRLANGETIAAAAAAEFLSLRTANRRIAQAREALGVRTTREAVLAYLRQRRA